jgi:peptidoglycan/xylan/chitin deacetylase (PgdA/CDA1 family)
VVSDTTTLLRAGLDALYYSGVSHLLRPIFGGVGAILALNRTIPPWSDPLRPFGKNAIGPRFLESVVSYLRRRRIDIVSPDELVRRLTQRDFRRRFVCLTLDGAYRDHFERAWPIFQKYQAPFTVFVPTGFPDRTGRLWWLAVAEVVARNSHVIMLLDGLEQRVDSATDEDKNYLYNGLLRWLLAREDNEQIVTVVRDLCARYGVDMAEICERACMTWEQIGTLSREPLVTIGAQSVNHPIMTKISPQRAERELHMSRAVIEGAIGITPKHFAFPFGQTDTAGAREIQMAKDAGYLTTMTLQPGVLTRAHANQLTALPRLSFGPGFQRLRYAKVAMSGLPSAIAARVRAEKMP